MARKKLEEPEKWITVNGQHLPVYPGGRIGAPGQKEIPNKKKSGKSYSLDKKDDNNYRVTNPEKGTSYTMTAKNAEDAWKQVVKAQRSGKIDQFNFGPEHIESLKPKKSTTKTKFKENISYAKEVLANIKKGSTTLREMSPSYLWSVADGLGVAGDDMNKQQLIKAICTKAGLDYSEQYKSPGFGKDRGVSKKKQYR